MFLVEPNVKKENKNIQYTLNPKISDTVQNTKSVVSHQRSKNDFLQYLYPTDAKSEYICGIRGLVQNP